MSNSGRYVMCVQPKIASTVNVPSDSGNSPLHAAANAGDVKLVSILLSASNINVNVINRQCDNATPLHLAVMHGKSKFLITNWQLYTYTD